MSGVFDRLQGQLGDQGEEEGGISPLELADLSPGPRQIIRLILREVEMGYPALCEAVAALTGEEHLDQAELDQALEDLTRQGWLIKMGEDKITYRVNLRRKAGSTLGLWGDLRSRIEKSQSPPDDEQA